MSRSVGRPRETPPATRPKLAVWKFASCDGCQLTLLNCEDELLTLAAEVEIADVAEFASVVYARPEYVSALATSTGIAEHVPVDFELRGCPIDRGQLLELLSALLTHRKPNIPSHSVCFECKRRGTVCV